VGALRERNFRRYFIGQSTSEIGSAMVPVALAFAVLRRTHSATDLGIVLTGFALAQLVFLLIGGVIADRISRRWAMLGADSLRCASEGLLAALLIVGRPSVSVIVVLVVIQGIASAVFMPASTGLVPALVNDEHLQQANSLLQITGSAANIVGPALSGVIVVTTSPGWALAADGFSYGVSVVALALLQLDTIKRPARQHFLADLRDGWNEFRSRDWYWKIVAAASVFNALYATYVVLGPVASLRFYSGASTWAAIAASAGAGAVAGGFVGLRVKVRYPMRIALGVVVLFGLAPLAISARLPVPVVATAAALGGAGIAIFSLLFSTTVQRHIPEALLSRVLSYDWFGSLVAYPIGLAIAAPLAQAIGLRTVLLIGGVTEIGIVLGMLAFIPSFRHLTARPDEVGVAMG
jgi:predicted MFS family arabinose efflux permease